MEAFTVFFKTLGAARILAMGVVTIALIGFFAFLITRVTAPQMAPLFTDLSLEDSAAIVKDLERQGVPFEIRNDGGTVMAPRDRVARLRMRLAEAGMPKGGGVGYEIFDKSDAIGATSFVQNINRLRALEGELTRTIRAIDRVQAARVHLVLPERPLFSRDRVEPSASIVLRVRGSLEPQQVRAIRHLVASAVHGLKPQRVSVVDENGRLLADGTADEAAGAGGSAEERRLAFERRLREQVEAIVTSVVGAGRAHVQLTADFDFNRITQTSDRFDPENRVVRSSQTREEVSASDNRDNPVTIGNQLPGAPPAAAANAPRDQNRKSEEIVNYEISRTTRTEVIEAGRLNRISVAVVVDGTYTRNERGEPVYQARPKEEIERISALVRTAIGFDASRGDQVEVANLRLAEVQTVSAEPAAAGWFGPLNFSRDDLMRAIELGVMALLAIIVLLVGVRPLIRRIVGPQAAGHKARTGKDEASGGVLIGPSGAALPGAGSQLSVVGSEEAAAITNRTSQMIDIAKVQGQVHAQSVQKVGELVEKNPNETVAVIREWLHERAA